MIISTIGTRAVRPALAFSPRALVASRWATWLVPLVIGTILIGPMNRVAAQEIGDIAAGRKLAETWCNSCHLIGPDAPSGSSNGAPPFAAVAHMESTTVLSLRAFLQTPHARMPDLHLTRDEIDDLAGYILSLRRPSAHSR